MLLLNSQQTAGLILIIAILVLIAVTIIVINVRNKTIKGFVLKNSKSINALIEINKKYTFCEYNERQDYYDQSNKMIDPDDFLKDVIKSRPDFFNNLIDMVNENRKLLKQYDEEIQQVNHPMTQEDCKTRNLNKCLELEKDLYRQYRLAPKVKLQLIVHYLGSKNTLTTKEYSFEEVVEVLRSVQ